ncbi:hypothetical protein AYL99_11777 [Fonsecaea erecta]|uniref:Uncharacterized protein n=1 Tax=Fonsecaea erecta TaxID=1367422 RepID=A0A178Z2R9_9EURO|nr:hypothetical protein AYL99_11777 [Fonsecaea erecta]OAP54017.1 hypothetical protein AYL99_11777 [Fonsecaea erecta]
MIIGEFYMIRNRMIYLKEGSEGHLISLDSELYFPQAFILRKLTIIMVNSVRLKYHDYNSTRDFLFDILERIGQRASG